MSQSIDQRIVEMKFDNAQFEKSVRQTISSLEQLEEALNFEDAEKGFENIENAATEVDLSHLEESVDKISDKFSAFGILGVQVMERLSNKIIDLGVSVAKSLSVDQLGAGWGKYESLMEASQVMVNNIRKEGETAEDVMPRVQEQINNILEYTDATSYSFDQLITTLGKFTSAGVELEDAVVMVEGIANWSATAGISAQRAAPMFYNLAQAMASGALKAQDWKSLELLSAQTPDFLNKAIEMGLAFGTIEDAGNGFYRAGKVLFNASEGFRDSLASGWFSKDVLGATLMAYGDTTEEFGQRAYDAAYQAKTFTDAVNAAKDAVSTGWTKTFEAVFGNYIEAAEFFTNIADYLIEIFNGGEALRNEAFKFWSDNGGREQFIDSLYKIFDIIIAIKDTIHEAIFNVLNPVRIGLNDEEKVMSDIQFVGETLLRITNGIASAINSIYNWLVGVVEPIKDTMHTIADEGEYIYRTIVTPIGETITYMTEVTRTVSETMEATIDGANNVVWHLTEVKTTADGVSDAFVDMRSVSSTTVKNLEKASNIAVNEKLAKEIYDAFPSEIKNIIKNGMKVDYKRTSDWMNADKWWDYQEAITGVDQSMNKALSHAYSGFGDYQKRTLQMIESGQIKLEDVDTSKWTASHLKSWEDYWKVRNSDEYKAVEEAERTAALQADEERAKAIYDSFPKEIKQLIKDGAEIDYKRTAGWRNEDKWWDYQQALTGIDQTDNKLLSHAYGEFGYYQKKALEMVENGTLTRDQVDTSKWTKPHLKAWEDYWAVRDRMAEEAAQAQQDAENSAVAQAGEATLLTAGRLENLQRIVQGVISVFNIAKRVISGVVKGVGKLLLKLTPLLDVFINIGAFLGDILFNVDLMGQVIEDKIGQAFESLGNLIRPVFQSIADWFKNTFGDFSTPEARAERLQELVEKVSTAYNWLNDKVRPVIESVTTWFSDQFNAIKTWFEGTTLYQALSNFFGAEEIEEVGADGQKTLKTVTFLDRLWASVSGVLTDVQAEFEKFKGTSFYQTLNDIFTTKVIGKTVNPDGSEAYIYETFFDRLVSSVTTGWTNFQNTDFYKFFVKAGNTIGSFFNDIFGTKVIMGKADEGYVYETFLDRLAMSISVSWTKFQNTDFYKFFVKAGNTIGSFFNDIFGTKVIMGKADEGYVYETFLDRLTKSVTTGWTNFQNTDFYKFFAKAGNTISTFFGNIFGEETVIDDKGEEKTVGFIDRFSGLLDTISEKWDGFINSGFVTWLKTTGESIGKWLSDTFGTKVVMGKADEGYVYETFFDRMFNSFISFKTKLTNFWTEFQKTDIYTFIKSYIGPIIEQIRNVFGNKPLFDEKGNAILDENGVQKVEAFFDRVNKVFAGINGIWEEIKKSPIYTAFNNAKNSIATFISNFIGDMSDPEKRAKKFEELSEKFSPITSFFTNVFDSVAGFFGFEKSAPKEPPKVGTPDYDQWVKSQIHSKDNLIASTGKPGPKPGQQQEVEDNGKQTVSFWKTLGTTIGNIFNAIVFAIGEIKTGFQEATGLKITDIINKVVSWILRIVAAVFLLKGIWAMMSFIQHYNQRARSLFTDISSIIFGLVAGLAVIMLAVHAFSKLKSTELKQGMDAVTSLLLMLFGGIVALLAAVSGMSFLKTFKSNQKAFEGVSKAISSVANFLRAIGVSVALLAVSVVILGNMGDTQFARGFTAVSRILLFLGIVTVILTVLASFDFKRFSPRAAAKSINSIAAMMVGIGASVLMLTASILILQNMDWQTFASAGLKVLAILGVVALITAGLIWFSSRHGTIGEGQKLPKELAALSAVITSIGVTVAILVGAIYLMTLIPEDKLGKASGIVIALTAVVGGIAIALMHTAKGLNRNAGKQIASLAILMLMISLVVGVLVAGMVVLANENVSWEQMLAYFAGIASVLVIMTGIMLFLDKANLGPGTLKGAVILTAAISILLVGLAAAFKLVTLLAKSAADDIAYIIGTVSYAISSSQRMLNGVTAEDFKPVVDIIEMFIAEAAKINIVSFFLLEEAVMDIYDVCTDINSAYNMIPPEGFKKRFDEAIEVIDAFKTKSTELEGVSFTGFGNATYYIEQFSAGLKTSGGLMTDAQKNSSALEWGLSTIDQILTTGQKAGSIQNLTELPSAMTNLGSAISLFFGLITDDETGKVINTSGKVDVNNIASIFTELATVMPDNTIIGQVSSYAAGGDNDMVQFGLGIVAIGEAMKQYQTNVENIESSKLEPATAALSFFQQLNADLRGGNVQQATTEASALNGTLTGFGNDIQILGESLKGYYTEVEGFEKAKFEPAADALDFFRILRNKLVGLDDNGNYTFQTLITSFLPTEDQLKKFGREIKQVGGSIKSYYDSVKDITWDKVRTSLNLLDFFNGLQRRLPSMEKAFLWFKDEKMGLTEFGQKIGQVGGYIQEFVNSILGISNNVTAQDGENTANNLSLLDENVRVAVNAAIDILRGFAEVQQTIGENYSGLRLKDFTWDIGTKMLDAEHLGALFNNSEKFKQLIAFGNQVKDSTNKSAIDGLVNFLNGFAGIQSQLNVGGAYVRINDFMGNLVGDDGLIKYMGKGGQLQGFINAASGIEVKDTQALVDLLTSWAKLESLLGEDYVGGYLPNLTEDMVAVLHGIGFDIVKGLSEGMEGDDVTGENGLMATSMETVKTAAFTAGSTEAYMSSLEPIGQYLVEGLAKGITDNAHLVSAAVESLSSDYVVTVAKKTLDENSPSKVFYGLGMYVDKGLAMGIDDYANVVAVSTSDVSQDALDRAKTILADISAGLTDDVSATPTITPVIDASQISSGMSSINGLFGNRTIGVDTERVRGLFSSSEKAETAVYNDSNVIQAIGDINERLNTLNENIAAMQIVLDTGVLTGALAPKIDRYLGRQARRN